MVKLSKEESLKKISLRKDMVKAVISKSDVLSGITARVALILDYSGSMSPLYAEGNVQAVIERVIPIGLIFDDNGAIDLWIFDTDFHYIGEVTRENFYGITDQIRSKYRDMGGTKYAPVIRDVLDHYIVKNPEKMADYCIFVTDGEPFDRSESVQAITAGSYTPTFWQFIGIGGNDFRFLRELDDMSGRYIDNANFFALNDLEDISDEELYERLFAEFPTWLKDSKVQEMLADPSAVKRKYTGKSDNSGGFFGRLFGR